MKHFVPRSLLNIQFKIAESNGLYPNFYIAYLNNHVRLKYYTVLIDNKDTLSDFHYTLRNLYNNNVVQNPKTFYDMVLEESYPTRPTIDMRNYMIMELKSEYIIYYKTNEIQYKGGHISTISNYVRDISHKSYRKFYKNGNIKFQGMDKFGVKTGKWIHYDIYGKILNITTFQKEKKYLYIKDYKIKNYIKKPVKKLNPRKKRIRRQHPLYDEFNY